jgi:hypothetical protein
MPSEMMVWIQSQSCREKRSLLDKYPPSHPLPPLFETATILAFQQTVKKYNLLFSTNFAYWHPGMSLAHQEQKDQLPLSSAASGAHASQSEAEVAVQP